MERRAAPGDSGVASLAGYNRATGGRVTVTIHFDVTLRQDECTAGAMSRIEGLLWRIAAAVEQLVVLGTPEPPRVPVGLDASFEPTPPKQPV